MIFNKLLFLSSEQRLIHLGYDISQVFNFSNLFLSIYIVYFYNLIYNLIPIFSQEGSSISRQNLSENLETFT